MRRGNGGEEIGEEEGKFRRMGEKSSFSSVVLGCSKVRV